MDSEKAITLIHQLECEVNYWRIEAQTDHGRWLRALEDLEKYRWQPIATVPFNQNVICLWATCTVGCSIFFTEHDVKSSYAKYWMPFPNPPTQ
jgi:hypothetical protein